MNRKLEGKTRTLIKNISNVVVGPQDIFATKVSNLKSGSGLG
jgi:hypothetical protein